jgi:hypothetical protein
MGIRLAMQAEHIYWLALIPSYADRLVLQRMAKQALDPPGDNGTPPCLYFAGRDPLILCLSNCVIPEPGTAAYRTQARKVSGCIKRLIDAKAIQRLDSGRKGHRGIYKLTLGGLRSPP